MFLNKKMIIVEIKITFINSHNILSNSELLILESLIKLYGKYHKEKQKLLIIEAIITPSILKYLMQGVSIITKKIDCANDIMLLFFMSPSE